MKNPKFKIQVIFLSLTLASLLLVTSDQLPVTGFAAVMSSTNYKIESDSINVGGTENSSSTNYRLSDTVGEAGTGQSGSASYNVYAGYRQMSNVYLAISAPSNVTMAPSLTSAGGAASNGSAVWTVTTDSPSGYTFTLKASSSPALQTSGDSFANYTPAGADPDFAFSVAAADSEFGFTAEGNDIAQRYKDNGSACNIGASDAADACWDAVTTSAVTIASRTSANNPSGTATT
ncbi:hypothetical protein L0Y69_02335, partial [bacterium]|nr:hypothetical protein [bacterium]